MKKRIQLEQDYQFVDCHTQGIMLAQIAGKVALGIEVVGAAGLKLFDDAVGIAIGPKLG